MNVASSANCSKGEGVSYASWCDISRTIRVATPPSSKYGLDNVSASIFCVHQPACVGCPLSHLPTSAQLELKQRQILLALQRMKIQATTLVGPTIGTPSTEGYRVRAKLVYDNKALGLYSEDHAVVDTRECRILDPRLREALNRVRDLLPLQSPLLAVDARLADEGLLLTLVVTEGSDPVLLQDDARRLLQLVPSLRGVAYSERKSTSVQVLGGLPIHLAGAKDLIHHLAKDKPYHVAVPGGFVQVHAGQASGLHDAIERELQSRLGALASLEIVELYAGAGALALRLAAQGARVTAIESFAPSVAMLERTAQEQRLHLRAIAASAETLPAMGKMDVLIVDPPRRGLSVEVRNSIAKASPRLVVYVSCEPRTLARDLSHLSWLGWSASAIQPFDMMPHSESVETLAILTPAPKPELEVVYRDATLLAVNKPPHIPTTPHAEYPVSLLELVQELRGCEKAAPIHRLDVGTSGVCLFATSPEHVLASASALTDGQKTYTALAQGVVHKRGTMRHALLEARTPRSAETRYERTAMLGTHSLVEAFPKQGRKHQIRRHFAKVKHALVGDTKYGSPQSARHFFERHGLDRPFLHCARIRISHNGVELDLHAELAPDLVVVTDSIAARPR